MCTRSARWFYGDNEGNVASLSVVKHNPTSHNGCGKNEKCLESWERKRERVGGGGGSQKNCAEIGVKDKK